MPRLLALWMGMDQIYNVCFNITEAHVYRLLTLVDCVQCYRSDPGSGPLVSFGVGPHTVCCIWCKWCNIWGWRLFVAYWWVISPSLICLRGGSRNSLRGGGVLGQNSSKGGFRVQVRGNFHILTSKKKKPLKEGFKPPKPPSGSATVSLRFLGFSESGE